VPHWVQLDGDIRDASRCRGVEIRVMWKAKA
jgi:hypothetical protein